MKVSPFAACSLVAAAALSLVACTPSGSAAPEASAGDEVEVAGAGADEVAPASHKAITPRYRIVTLGDSYTYGAGTDAKGRDSWPAQLKASLEQRAGMRIALYNLARESSTSDEVLEDQVAMVGDYEPDVVTLQVGVNDLVAGATDGYGDNIAAILDELLTVLPADRIFVVTTPDHTLTEWGKAYGTQEAVDELNASLYEAALTRDIEVIDIGPVNERVSVDASLLVVSEPPKPYPTAKQYAGWAEAIGPYVHGAVTEATP